MLDANQLDSIVLQLENERNRIQDNLKTLLNDGLKLNPDDFPDEVDLATSELNQAMILRLKDRDQAKLNKIEDALSRIRSNSYGICTDCDEKIEFRRLEVSPFATLCVHCKEQEERASKANI